MNISVTIMLTYCLGVPLNDTLSRIWVGVGTFELHYFPIVQISQNPKLKKKNPFWYKNSTGIQNIALSSYHQRHPFYLDQEFSHFQILWSHVSYTTYKKRHILQYLVKKSNISCTIICQLRRLSQFWHLRGGHSDLWKTPNNPQTPHGIFGDFFLGYLQCVAVHCAKIPL